LRRCRRSQITAVDLYAAIEQPRRITISTTLPTAEGEAMAETSQSMIRFCQNIDVHQGWISNMEGMETLRRLRQTSDVLVMFLTSKDEEIDSRWAQFIDEKLRFSD
jgi:hypothetical protein